MDWARAKVIVVVLGRDHNDLVHLFRMVSYCLIVVVIVRSKVDSYTGCPVQRNRTQVCS